MALSALLLAGCSGQPSQSAGESVLDHLISSQSKGGIKLLRFTKTNGSGNDSFYRLEYEAEIEFESNGMWTKGSSAAPSVQYGFSPGQATGNGGVGLMMGALGGVNVQQGQHETVRSTLTFQKTDQGWRGEDGQMY
jgi:hypothetical protein